MYILVGLDGTEVVVMNCYMHFRTELKSLTMFIIGLRYIKMSNKFREVAQAIVDYFTNEPEDDGLAALSAIWPTPPAQAAQVDAMKVLARLARHADDCLSHNVLPTGAGNWHCDCGYDRYVLDGEPTAAAFAPTAESVALPRCWDAQGNPCCDAPTAEPAAQGEVVTDADLAAAVKAYIGDHAYPQNVEVNWNGIRAALESYAASHAAQPRAVPDGMVLDELLQVSKEN